MNKVRLLTLWVLLGLIPQYAFSEKIPLNYKENHFDKKRQHPAEQYLSSIKKDSQKRSSSRFSDKSYNKLLIILVGFQEETIDDPNTTGNGQFQLDIPDNYPIQLAKPPHNQKFFDKMAEAMKYYYDAASLRNFNLEWDIYPKAEDKSCYTLSQPMGYYNPPGATNEEFVSKMEEYFKEAFETADRESPEIVFSDYAHYMIIHAGSDWQHDVLADTPSDIPSFFIRVGDGKEAIVDEGSYAIDYACNVPETITQDIREYSFDGEIQVSGYGALNGVMFHEFGHSLGLIDLYAVNSSYPMVGTFDIMDSGGSSEVGMLNSNDGKTYSIEGLIPGLPGAFSRVLMFEDVFRQEGILKDIEDLSVLQNIRITCSENRHDLSKDPYIYKLQISPTEYILVENRNVDPDGDGGTAVYTDLDGRIALYPTAYNDDDNVPTFEYDFLLPSFISDNGEAVGGGLLVWKVNEDVLFNQGSYDSQGNFISNFDSNYINTNYDQRGVEIIEADGIPDIGNVYAYHWRGTAFEYYFKHMPIFENSNGYDFFTGWSDDIHNTELNATSSPRLTTASGNVISSGLYNISQSDSLMTFSYGSPILTKTTSIKSDRKNLAVSPFYKGISKLTDIAIIHQSDANLYYYSAPDSDFQDFATIQYDSALESDDITYPIQKVDFNDDDNEELVIFSGHEMMVIRNDASYKFELKETPKSRPQFFGKKFFVPLDKRLLKVKFDVETNTIENKELDYAVNHIVASENNLYFFTDDTIEDFPNHTSVELPATVTNKPVILSYQQEGSEGIRDYVIFYTDDNALYYYFQNEIKLIYDYSNVSNIFEKQSTQLALDADEEGPYVIFALGNKVYANYLDGTFPLHFPRTFHNYEFSGHNEIMIFDNSYLNNDDVSHFGKTIYLPIENNSYIGWDVGRNVIDPALVIADQSKKRTFSYAPLSETDTLGYFYQLNTYDQSVIIQWRDKKISDNPVSWETDNHNINRSFRYIQKTNNNQETNNKISAYVFPNPVAKNQATVRIFNLKNQATFKIFDISGKFIKEIIIETNKLEHVDKTIDFSNISSGIYIGVVEAESTYKFKFAVTK